jgi:hypothetical protein
MDNFVTNVVKPSYVENKKIVKFILEFSDGKTHVIHADCCSIQDGFLVFYKDFHLVTIVGANQVRQIDTSEF